MLNGSPLKSPLRLDSGLESLDWGRLDERVAALSPGVFTGIGCERSRGVIRSPVFCASFSMATV
ncbi:MAG: hypothetical protein RL367_683 [Pseudomonadota bacterium]